MKDIRTSSHLKALEEYYDCLNAIHCSYGLVNSSQEELSWYENKLQEGRQLVKSFSFTDHELKNLPKVTHDFSKNKRKKVQRTLELISQTGKEIVEQQKFVNDSTQQVKEYFLSKPRFEEELKELKKQKILLVSVSVIYWIFVVGLVLSLIPLVISCLFLYILFISFGDDNGH